MLLDLHNHTRYSPDSRVSPADLVGIARRIGLDGVPSPAHQPSGRGGGGEGGAACGWGAAPPRGLGAAETIERIVALGGVPVAAHPYRFWSGLGEAAVRAAPFPAHPTGKCRTPARRDP